MRGLSYQSSYGVWLEWEPRKRTRVGQTRQVFCASGEITVRSSDIEKGISRDGKFSTCNTAFTSRQRYCPSHIFQFLHAAIFQVRLCMYKFARFSLAFSLQSPHKLTPNFSIKSIVDMNKPKKKNSREDRKTLGPGRLEDVGLSDWLQTSAAKKRPTYDLNSNQGLFLGRIRFISMRARSNAEEIMMTLKNKNRRTLCFPLFGNSSAAATSQ